MDAQDGLFKSPKQGSFDHEPEAAHARQESSERPHQEPRLVDGPSKDSHHSETWKGKGRDTMTPIAAYLKDYQHTSTRPSLRHPAERTGPLQLLDLPLDVLQAILKEVPHTNDLTSLASTCSALHSIVIPLIYSRFDIVWPDALNITELRTGVDALTYGIATLVMREDLFENSMLETGDPGRGACQSFACKQCGNINYISKTPTHADQSGRVRRLRRGNYFSNFTKKFSLGNGPQDWVQEYLVTKEGGKMLGTLVALSVARMPNLEVFIWDMPTGILRDIWVALSSLGDYRPSKLRKLWVRFHDHKAAVEEAGVAHTTTNGHLSQGDAPQPPPQSWTSTVEPDLSWSEHQVEQPNFSSLPALESLTVLAVDELAYLDEMSSLLKFSLDRMRILRVGMASKLHTSGMPWNDQRVECVRKEGALALLMSKIFDSSTARPKQMDLTDRTKPVLEPTLSSNLTQVGPELVEHDAISHTSGTAPKIDHDEETNAPLIAPTPTTDVPLDVNYASIDPALTQGATSSENSQSSNTPGDSVPGPMTKDIVLQPTDLPDIQRSRSPSPSKLIPDDVKFPTAEASTGTNPPNTKSSSQSQKLKLEQLELEKMHLNVTVFQKTIDLPFLTRLTLLHCRETESLWKSLRRTYAPLVHRPKSVLAIPSISLDKRAPQPRLRHMPSSCDSQPPQPSYQLSLTYLHTDTVSSALLYFLKETLAPNSLHTLLLQDHNDPASTVSVEAIYKGPLKRHRASLQRLMLYSGNYSDQTHSVGARRWMLSRDILTFITSGKMKKLRELAMVVAYKDWHYFLQRIPSIPHLRSLYVPYIADHVYSTGTQIRELAMGVVDVVMLRPECELCYLAISAKCFELVESKARKKGVEGGEDDEDTEDEALGDGNDDDHEHDDEDDDGGGDDDDGGDDDGGDGDTETTGEEADASDGGEESEDEERGRFRVKLRDILFYDDKVAIFKARHGKL